VLEDSDAKVDRQIDAVVQGIIDEDAQVDDASVNEDDPDVLDAKEVAKRKPKEVSEEELAKNMEKASVKTAGGDIREEHGDGKKDYGIDDKVNTIAPIIVTAKALDFETFKGSDLFENPASPESLYGVDSEGVAHKYNPDGSEVRLSKKGQSEVKKYVAAKTPVEESEAPSAAVAESKIGVSGLARILEGFEIPDVTPDEDKPTSRVYQDAKTYVFTKGQSAWTKSIEMFGTADYVKTIEMLVSEQRGTPKRSIILKGKEIETRIIDGKSYIVKKLIKGDTVWKSAKVIARDTNTPIVNVYENLIADNSHIADLSKVDVGEEVYIRMDHYSKK
jgi:hypothetical protein